MASTRLPCADCGARSLIYARGLCSRCYDEHEAAGDLGKFPTGPDLTALDFAFLRLIAGLDVGTAAARLHMEYRSGLVLDRRMRREGLETRTALI